jgi:hypothetical protein
MADGMAGIVNKLLAEGNQQGDASRLAVALYTAGHP